MATTVRSHLASHTSHPFLTGRLLSPFSMLVKVGTEGPQPMTYCHLFLGIFFCPKAIKLYKPMKVAALPLSWPILTVSPPPNKIYSPFIFFPPDLGNSFPTCSHTATHRPFTASCSCSQPLVTFIESGQGKAGRAKPHTSILSSTLLINERHVTQNFDYHSSEASYHRGPAARIVLRTEGWAP